MPSFHCERTSSHEYKWNSTSCPEGVPRKKKGVSTAKAAVAIDISGAHPSLPRPASRETLPRRSFALDSPPDFVFAASFAPTSLPAESLFRVGYMFAQGQNRCTKVIRGISALRSRSWMGCCPLGFNRDLILLKPSRNSDQLPFSHWVEQTTEGRGPTSETGRGFFALRKKF